MSLTEMTIVGAIKELKVIKKRMMKNSTQITKYSSQPDAEKALCGDIETQKKEVKSLIQANEDLAKRFSDIHTALTYTNLIVHVNMDGKDYTIHELILMRRELHTLLGNTYKAMNDSNFDSTMRRQSYGSDGKVHVERFYDEKFKQNKLREIDDLYHAIDARLENVNATTNLQEIPGTN